MWFVGLLSCESIIELKCLRLLFYEFELFLMLGIASSKLARIQVSMYKICIYTDTRWCVMDVNMHRLQAATSLMGLPVRSGSRLAGRRLDSSGHKTHVSIVKYPVRSMQRGQRMDKATKVRW